MRCFPREICESPRPGSHQKLGRFRARPLHETARTGQSHPALRLKTLPFRLRRRLVYMSASMLILAI
eukprot:5858914-Alexandrium_andersonii.AAC.1